ncbi:mandelate racemase/muconate lactonizing enzyme family protein [Haladaptatus sp. YSMS36]|uniref:mandelate racemase/muconate lactonizing enzyme family protein n=1 Tax=Haladaptatus sp. YSMS36 TaxID=3033384 RepID=UPI0023E8F366|nr:mandelate racemase/muconate lactonizing enzyme family protein [Haladaptatus sp. YSMS36]
MKIKRISVRLIACPLERTVVASSFTKTRRCTVLVTIETDSGIRGRIYAGDKRDHQEQIATYIIDDIAPLLIDEELFSVERLWERAVAGSSTASDRDLYMHALGAVDSAIWDAIGKALDVPLYQLWGGYQDTLPMIAIGGYYEDDKDLDGLVAEATEYRELGLDGIKLKVGGASIEEDIARLAAIRKELGDEYCIACDANRAWSVIQAITFAERAIEYDLAWLEEPVVWFDQYRGMREVRQRTNIPVTAGQNETAPSGCVRLLNESSVDILNYDASLGGGPTAWHKVAATAGIQGITMGHHEEPHLAMHLLASIPNSGHLEGFHPDLDPIWYQMVENRPPVEDGRLRLPEGPGFGLTFCEEFIQKYTVDTAAYGR